MPYSDQATHGRKRNKRLDVRLTEDEYALIRARAEAGGYSISDYVAWRCIYMDGALPLPPRTEVRDLYLELVREGTNLNQIARACNRIATIDVSDASLAVRVARDLQAIRIEAVEARESLQQTYRRVMDAWDRGRLARQS